MPAQAAGKEELSKPAKAAAKDFKHRQKSPIPVPEGESIAAALHVDI